MESTSNEARSPATPDSVGSLSIDLAEEARYLTRQRSSPTVLGLVLGTAFVVIGGVEAWLLHTTFPSADSLIAVLLVVLGTSLDVVTVRGGLLNPATRIFVDEKGLLLVRRWGPEISLEWKDPMFDLDLQDPAPDRLSQPEDKQHVFFTASGGGYGSLPRSEVGPLLDLLQEHGETIRMSVVSEGKGRARRKIRRVRIGPPAG